MWPILFATGAAIVLELKTPQQHDGIYDFGFVLVDTLVPNKWQRALTSNTASMLNSIALVACLCLVLMDGPLMLQVTALFWLRCLIGYFTRLPVPAKVVLSPCEIPPAGLRYFHLFSAHTMVVASVSLYMYDVYGVFAGFVFGTVLALQSVRLLLTRGHYSADIILAVSFSYLMRRSTFK